MTTVPRDPAPRLPILRTLAFAAWTALCLTACGGHDAPGAHEGQEGHEEHAGEEAKAPTNRIEVPAAVRQNLGITFAKAEVRDVRATLRVPGSFELRPDAHRAYHGTLSGQVELLVKQYARVHVGDLLYRVDSPAWRRMQAELSATVLAIRKLRLQLDALRERMKAVDGHAAGLRKERTVWKERLTQVKGIAAAGGGIATVRTQARAQLAATETALAEVVEEHADLRAKQIAWEADLQGYRESTPLLCCEALGEEAAATSPLDLALSRAASLLGVHADWLRERVGTNGRTRPRWRTIERLDVLARQEGVVENLTVTNGAWIEVGQTVLETVDPTRLRFRAAGLQADLGKLRDGLAARILPPGGHAAGAGDVLEGTLQIGLEADPLDRKIDLLVTPTGAARPTWARRGVSTEMEVVVAGTSEPNLAIPRHAVIQDGLHKVIFRRNPKNPDQVIRIEADLGVSDGRWVTVESGLVEGDEVVRDGVYELMLASGGAKQKGGHFHADGTFHEKAD